MKMGFNFDPKGKRILAITAHADDADFCCGGTLLKWISEGAKAGIVIVTNGDKGSHNKDLTPKEIAALRQKEQLAASEVLGIENTWFLDYPDAQLEVSQELKEKLVKIIRTYKPDVVFTWDPTMVYSLEQNMVNHPDHRAVGQATLDAIFPMARDPFTFPDQIKDGLEPHCVEHVLLFNFDSPNHFIDVSSVFDKKLELLQKHESQVDSGNIRKELIDWNSRVGKKINSAYAEPFVHISFDKD